MTSDEVHHEPADATRPTIRFRLVHVFYVMAVLGTALATFGSGGLRPAIPILGF